MLTPRQSSTLNLPKDELQTRYGYKFSTKGYGSGPWQTSFPSWQWPDGCKFNHYHCSCSTYFRADTP